MDTWDEVRGDTKKILGLIDQLGWNKEQLVENAEKFGGPRDRVIRNAYRGVKLKNAAPLHAIVWAINVELRKRNEPEISIDAIVLRSTPSPISDPMGFAKLKLVHDYEGSCVHDAVIHDEAVREGNRRLGLLIKSDEGSKIQVGQQFHIPKSLYLPIDRKNSSKFEDSIDELRLRFESLVTYSAQHPIVVSNECIEVGALATFLSLWKRYNIRMDIDFDDTSGREQILRSNKGTFADFMVTADAPFLLASSGAGTKFARRTPLHFEDQYILVRRLHDVDWDDPNLLVYADSSASEQLVVENLERKHSYKPKYCYSLGDLVAKAMEMRTGDGIVAWEPLASGLLQSIKGLTKSSKAYKIWLSLYCNTDWIDDTDLAKLRVLFEEAFLSEWKHCKNDVAYAQGLLEKDANEVGYSRARFCEKLAVGIGLQRSVLVGNE